MKKHLPTLVLFAMALNLHISHAQCPIPNRDFTKYWIASTLTNGADLFDPGDWTCTWTTGENAINYFESGLFPAPGIEGQNAAVEFFLTLPITETGIRTLEPIVCDHFPSRVTGHFKHLGTGSDTLYFTIKLSDVDIFGDTTREALTAKLICNTLIDNAFQSFDIPMPAPHFSIYTQIDTLEIVYKSISFEPGPFILDDLDFGYTSAAHENEFAQNIRISPTITRQKVQILLPKPLPGLQINLADAGGMTILSKRFDSEEVMDLDLAEMTAGVYFLQCSYPKEQIHFTRKIVKF